MRPAPDLQIRWGVAAAAVTVLVVGVLALVPDPFFRQRVYVTTFDDVQALTKGAPVFFGGAQVGSVRGIELAPKTQRFAVTMGVDKAWRPASCSFARIVESNPLTTPKLELSSVDATGAACTAVQTAARCETLPPPEGARSLLGCKRGDDMFETAATAIAQAAKVVETANAMALQIQAMMPKPGAPGAASVDVEKLVADVTGTLASINQMTARLNATLTPGQGDVARTLANVRTASGQAAAIDVASINATIKRAEAVIAENQTQVRTMMNEGAAISGETRALLENLSVSMATAGANLQRTTENLDALTERLSDDPTYAVRGQKFSDPPSPETKP